MIVGALLAKKNLLIDKIQPNITKSEIDILKKIGIKIIKKIQLTLLKVKV